MKRDDKRATADAPYKVLYDADCKFCRDALGLLRALDKYHLTEGVPLCSDAIEDLKIPATISDCSRRMHIISASGRVYVGYHALLRLAALFPQTNWISRLSQMLIPEKLGCRLYDVLADNRYRLGCSGQYCKLSRSEHADKNA